MDVGVAILATDRIHCTMRLIESMNKYSGGLNEYDLYVFDDSSHSSDELKRYIDDTNKANNKNITYIKTGNRIGIAKNTNAALEHLKEYEYKFIFNNDMIIKNKDWVDHYISASIKTGIHHFSFYQSRLWGARTTRPCREHSINGIELVTINENPHGSLLFLTKKAHETVGYFDSKLFNGYGKSHHMFSHSVSQSRIQPSGIHDTEDSNLYFKVFDEKSTTPDKPRREDYKRNTKIFEKELKKLKSGERSVYTDAE